MNTVYPWREAPSADFAVIGDPVSHSKSPRMHAAAYAAAGLSYTYVAVHVPAGEVSPALDRLADLGYRGVNVTVPHKDDAQTWCTDVEPFAAKVRAVNTVRLVDKAGINTDAPGFLDTLGGRPAGTALLLGAGGSARALALALSQAGWRLRVHNRTKARAVEMVEALELSAELLDNPDPLGADLILNTTSASLHAADLGIDWSRATPGALAYDLMYAKEPTPFLEQAAAQGLETIDGLPLLIAQGARSFEWWTGVPAPREAMRKALE